MTLATALQRIMENEGGTPNCELTGELEGLTVGTVCSVEAIARRPAGEAAQEIYRVDRSMKNWAILRNGTEVMRAHPWDATPNIAYLVGKAGVSKAVGSTMIEEVESLARRFERHRLFGESLVMWRTALSLCTRVGDKRLVHARSEATRLQQVIQAQATGSQAASVG